MFLALKTIFENQNGMDFICTLRLPIVRGVGTGKGSGADLEEFTKLNSEDLTRKMKSLALREGFIIVVNDSLHVVIIKSHL